MRFLGAALDWLRRSIRGPTNIPENEISWPTEGKLHEARQVIRLFHNVRSASLGSI
jgi:hypothetical protein